MKWMHRNIVALVVAVALAVGLAAPIAVQAQVQSGLVNVAIGDITIQDIGIGIAAQVAAAVCGLNVGPVAVLAVQAVRTSNPVTVCTTQQGDLVQIIP